MGTVSAGVRLLLSAGRGPLECDWALAELLRRLEHDAARLGVGVRRLDTVAGAVRGTYRSAQLHLAGPDAARFARSWSGTLCWRAPSPYRPTLAVVVVDTERRLSDNRRLALELLQQRVEQAAAEARRAAADARWRTHDQLVRGNPTRTERPERSSQGRVGHVNRIRQ
jgi:peptide chain release factor